MKQSNDLLHLRIFLWCLNDTLFIIIIRENNAKHFLPPNPTHKQKSNNQSFDKRQENLSARHANLFKPCFVDLNTHSVEPLLQFAASIRLWMNVVSDQ